MEADKSGAAEAEAVELFCLRCGVRASSRCGRCKKGYCGRECQRLDWPTHRTLCMSGSKVVVPFMIHRVHGTQKEFFIYTTPPEHRPDEFWLAVTMDAREKFEKLFPDARVFLFMYLHLPPISSGKKAQYCYHSLVTKEGAAHVDALQHHMLYVENVELVMQLLRDSTAGKPIGFATYIQSTGDVHWSEKQPEGVKTKVFDGQ